MIGILGASQVVGCQPKTANDRHCRGFPGFRLSTYMSKTANDMLSRGFPCCRLPTYRSKTSRSYAVGCQPTGLRQADEKHLRGFPLPRP